MHRADLEVLQFPGAFCILGEEDWSRVVFMLGFSAFQILETSPQVPCTSGVPDQCCLWDIHVANYFPYPLAYRFIAIYFFRRYEDTHLKRFVKPCWSQP